MTELKEEDIHREGKEFGDEKVDEEEFIRTEECRIFDGEITP